MPVVPGPRVLGKKAFVTGAARGLGEAIARMLASRRSHSRNGAA